MSKSPWMNIMPNGAELIRLADFTPGRYRMRSSIVPRERREAVGPVVEAFGQRHLDGLYDAVAPARFEAGRHRREAHEAMDQQARADQEDERHRDLRGDQQRPQPLALTVARRAPVAGVQREAFAKR